MKQSIQDTLKVTSLVTNFGIVILVVRRIQVKSPFSANREIFEGKFPMYYNTTSGLKSFDNNVR